jgi:hypothetical protein
MMLAAEAARHPTPYPDVNQAVLALCSQIKEILQGCFAGMYLDGSLASGDFDPRASDIDFVVTTTRALRDEQVAALTALHARFAAGDSPWAERIEGSYIPRDVLGAYDPLRAPAGYFPRIELGSPLRVVAHESDWLFHRAILREQGIAVAGPAPRDWLEPVAPEALRRAVADNLAIWWAGMLDEPGPLHDPRYRAYAFLTMCRMLYTLEQGRIASKPAAVAWAATHVGAEWGAIGARAFSVRATGVTPDVEPVTLEEARAAIRAVVARA